MSPASSSCAVPRQSPPCRMRGLGRLRLGGDDRVELFDRRIALPRVDEPYSCRSSRGRNRPPWQEGRRGDDRLDEGLPGPAGRAGVWMARVDSRTGACACSCRQPQSLRKRSEGRRLEEEARRARSVAVGLLVSDVQRALRGGRVARVPGGKPPDRFRRARLGGRDDSDEEPAEPGPLELAGERGVPVEHGKCEARALSRSSAPTAPSCGRNSSPLRRRPGRTPPAEAARPGARERRPRTGARDRGALRPGLRVHAGRSTGPRRRTRLARSAEAATPAPRARRSGPGWGSTSSTSVPMASTVSASGRPPDSQRKASGCRRRATRARATATRGPASLTVEGRTANRPSLTAVSDAVRGSARAGRA